MVLAGATRNVVNVTHSVDAFTSIVVGIDGRAGGQDALALAQTLAPSAHLTLVTAYGVAAIASTIVDGARQASDDVLARVIAEHAPDADTRALAHRSAGHALQDVAAEIQASLIVIGSARRGPLGRVLVGDDCRATIHGSPHPVAIAPHGYAEEHPPVTRILVGLNGTPESEAALVLATHLARDIDASVRAVVIIQAPDPVASMITYTTDWSRFLERERTHAQALLDRVALEHDGLIGEILEGKPHEELQRLSHHADLVVVGSRDWGASRRIAIGSTTDQLVHHAACPLLVTPRAG